MDSRPFGDARPLGPFVRKEKGEDQSGIFEGKYVIGISGTPMPGKSKSEMTITYVIGGGSDRIVMYDEYIKNVQRKMDARYDGVRVTYKKSGKSSKAPFDEPAVTARIKGKSLPIEDSTIHDMEGVIERAFDGDLYIDHIIIDEV